MYQHKNLALKRYLYCYWSFTAASSTAMSPACAHRRHLTARGCMYIWQPIHHIFYVCCSRIEVITQHWVAHDVGRSWFPSGKTPNPDSHSIVVHDINNPLTPLALPLYIHGVTSWLPVSKPSLEDWNYMKYQTIELTAEKLDW